MYHKLAVFNQSKKLQYSCLAFLIVPLSLLSLVEQGERDLDSLDDFPIRLSTHEPR